MIKKYIQIQKEKNTLIFSQQGIYVVFFSNQSLQAEFIIRSEQVSVYIFGLFDLNKNQHVQVRTCQRHVAAKSFSQLNIKSILREKSRMDFDGLIRIEKQAQLSHAYQKSQSLIVDESAFVDIRPKLEIEADDVFCTHGSTISSVSTESLYYIHSRGVSFLKAKQLSIDGFKTDIIDQIKKVWPSFQYPYEIKH